MALPDVANRRRLRNSVVVGLVLLAGLFFFANIAPHLIGGSLLLVASLIWGVAALVGLALLLVYQLRRVNTYAPVARAGLRARVLQMLVGFAVIAAGVTAANVFHVPWLDAAGFLGGMAIIFLSMFGVTAFRRSAGAAG
jgi:hypothetical protein